MKLAGFLAVAAYPQTILVCLRFPYFLQAKSIVGARMWQSNILHLNNAIAIDFHFSFFSHQITSFENKFILIYYFGYISLCLRFNSFCRQSSVTLIKQFTLNGCGLIASYSIHWQVVCSSISIY